MIYASWQTDPVLIGGLFAALVAYLLAVGPLRRRLAPGAPFPKGQAAWFTAGIATMYLVDGSPLHDLAERYSLTMHMLQHTLLSYVVAPMLLMGLPGWVARPLLLARAVRPVSRALLHPVVTFSVFSLAFSIWHLPAIYSPALTNSFVHHTQHLVFLTFSLMLWWPLMSRVPELPRLAPGVQLIYLFALPLAQLPVFAAVTFSDYVLYPAYELAPRLFPLSALEDQALSGAFMNVAGQIAFGIPFIVIFFHWFRLGRERRVAHADPAGVR